MKKCSKCEIEKESIDFYKKKTMNVKNVLNYIS